MRRVLVGVTYGGIALSVALMALVGACRFPSAVPAMDGDGVFPRLTWPYTSDVWATALLWAAMISGFSGVVAGLAAGRGGPRPRGLVAGGLLAVGVLVAAPPMGTTDTMDYAVYGRMAVLGHDPHVMTPREFRATGDRVGALAPEPWQDTPSVYGPLATGTEWAAATLSGGSATATVFWLKVWNALAFLAAALALARLAGPGSRARVHLLWTLNPLLLWALIGGAHVDGLAAGLAVTGLAVAGPSVCRSLWRSGTAGVLLGAAGAVKAPYLLLGAVAVWSLRRSPRALVALGVGAATVLAASYAIAGGAGIVALAHRGRSPSWNTPWQLLVPVLGRLPSWLPLAAVVLAAVVAARLLRDRTRGPVWLGPALAVCTAWVVTTPVYYPWYEALVLPLVALAPASRLDWVQLTRALVATVGCLPGLAVRFGGTWLRTGPLPYVVPGALLLLLMVLLLLRPAALRRRSGPECRAAASSPAS
ncbi:polyprenol phosphomannose-dependent alpha 1,6 mannosyltransferase MptB [Actinoallomurus sp. CA-142502]|uniref:polyprenol phosphomannose-dependent alpha 1,6 mannosyltransferase MptB n=1 Tax=Actinoallomurus sp. CA-142502 TaxID=3239885 RepID=UPI003D94906C